MDSTGMVWTQTQQRLRSEQAHQEWARIQTHGHGTR